MSETQPLVGGGEKGTNYSGGPPPAYSWPPSQPAAPYPAAPTATVVTQTPVIVQQQILFGPNPVTVTCPNGHEVTTTLSYKSGSLTWIVALLLCLFLGPCCALIPFCVDGMKDVEHTCPVDGQVLGVYKRSM